MLLATDDDREGEAISWHLAQVLDLDNLKRGGSKSNKKGSESSQSAGVPYKRAVFHEITKEAVKHAFESPRDIDMDLVQSQETRRILDRLAGFTVSPLLWRYIVIVYSS